MPIRRRPAGLSASARLGFNVVVDGRNLSFILDGYAPRPGFCLDRARSASVGDSVANAGTASSLRLPEP